jgi:UDP-N-acetylmuramoyl-L-alanyl-D-glutamate--2,6-diaminopimelate ligase
MRLDDLLDGIQLLDMSNLFDDMPVARITCDSRKVDPGSVFVAIPGDKADGHDFISDALAAGATAVIQSRPLEPGAVGSFLRVADPREVYAVLCSRIAGNPSGRMKVIGVTGTNCKTSTTLIARHLLESAGLRAAAIGTLGVWRPGSDEFQGGGLTTPDAADLQEILAGLADEGTQYVLLEVSSHALHQRRVSGIEFAGGVFTNLTQDHYDYHGSYEEYRDAKALLFTRHLVESGGYAVLNTDDEAGRHYAAHSANIALTYGMRAESNLVCDQLDNSIDGLSFRVVLKNGVWPESLDLNLNTAQVQMKLVGAFNAYNSAAAAGIALLEGLSLEQVVDGLFTFSGVPGRLQRVDNPAGVHVFVDYAHTPDALENVLRALVELKRDGCRLITVAGCGGDRDRAKRPLMGAAALAASDWLVVTSDNPRTEDPEAIIDEIVAGLPEGNKGWEREVDRRQAIHTALRCARPGDIVLVAGKGHEDYQILGTQKVHFSDIEEVQRFYIESSS